MVKQAIPTARPRDAFPFANSDTGAVGNRAACIEAENKFVIHPTYPCDSQGPWYLVLTGSTLLPNPQTNKTTSRRHALFTGALHGTGGGEDHCIVPFDLGEHCVRDVHLPCIS